MFRLSKFWVPTAGTFSKGDKDRHAHSLLLRAGFIHPRQAGIFHYLPLGQRVLDRTEARLDQRMQNLGASKVSLSTFSPESLWSESGRLANGGGELFRLEDRKGTKLLLSPTHEEEITALVRSKVSSYRDLPLRLYQVSRKYRDERRPRQGLLRSREFLMKDLYTFDTSVEAAMETYHAVRAAYDAFFSELRVPFAVVEADSGSIGGDLSHEYHVLSSEGEDDLFACDSCGYGTNAERIPNGASSADMPCPKCGEVVQARKAIELGHAFLLGTKYSQPMNAMIQVPVQGSDRPASRFLEMGCYGIGVSRILAAMATVLADDIGLNWPRVIAPFDVIVVYDHAHEHANAAVKMADQIAETLPKGQPEMPVDVIVDDRAKGLGWKLIDADRTGYPITVVLGRDMDSGLCEVQCRRLNLTQSVKLADTSGFVASMLEKL